MGERSLLVSRLKVFASAVHRAASPIVEALRRSSSSPSSSPTCTSSNFVLEGPIERLGTRSRSTSIALPVCD